MLYVAEYEASYAQYMSWMLYAIRLDNIIANSRQLHEHEEYARHSVCYYVHPYQLTCVLCNYVVSVSLLMYEKIIYMCVMYLCL